MRVAIVLAAGSSRRFGRADKLLAVAKGKPLLAHAIDRACETGAPHVLIVVRRRDARIVRLARARGLTIAHAPDAATGLSASLRAGLAALRPIEREAWIFLADMPLAQAPRLRRLKDGAVAARPDVGGRPGHPMLVRVAAARSAMPRGDRGLVSALPGGAVARWRGGAGDLLDIDDRAALRRFRHHA